MLWKAKGRSPPLAQIISYRDHACFAASLFPPGRAIKLVKISCGLSKFQKNHAEHRQTAFRSWTTTTTNGLRYAIVLCFTAVRVPRTAIPNAHPVFARPKVVLADDH